MLSAPGMALAASPATEAGANEILIADRIAAIGREAWERCLPGEAENYDYYLAVEEAGVPGFAFRYLAVREAGRIIALAPAFLTEYRLDTTVSGGRRRLIEACDRLVPFLTRLKLIALGSPVAEACHVGLDPQLAPERRREAMAALLGALEEAARRESIGLIGIKDLPGESEDFAQAARRASFHAMPGQATAFLDLPFATPDAYLKALSPAARKDVRRKMRAGSGLRHEWRHEIDDVLDRVMALYDETFESADLKFERLGAAYFTRVLERLEGRALCLLTWAGEDLVAFNLVLLDKGRLIDKFLGMHYAAVKPYNLYYTTWMANVQLCLDKGIGIYQSGQGGEAAKRHLGCRFSANTLYFRHRRPLPNLALRLVARFVRLAQGTPDPAREEAE